MLFLETRTLRLGWPRSWLLVCELLRGVKDNQHFPGRSMICALEMSSMRYRPEGDGSNGILLDRLQGPRLGRLLRHRKERR